MSGRSARRLEQLPPYLFIEIDRLKKGAVEAGRDVIDFGVGDPDRPTPGFVIDRMAEAIRDPANHTYPLGAGLTTFRTQAAKYMAERFGVDVDPCREVLALIGSKEGLGHLPLAIVNPGDGVLIPTPGYPVYQAATLFAGGRPCWMPLLPDRGFLPDLSAIPRDVLDQAALMYLNYPNNPTGATARPAFWAECVDLARRHDIIICSDAAYAELYFDEQDRPHSILEAAGAKEVCIEMHSLSKTFNMTGWRIAFAVGNAEVLTSLAKIKGNMDSGVFGAVQHSGVAALRGIHRPEIVAMRRLYQDRRDRLVGGLREAGFPVEPPRATFYVWAGCPAGYDSMTCARRMLEEEAIVAIPGVGFGEAGDGYVRFALTVEADRIGEAVERLARMKW